MDTFAIAAFRSRQSVLRFDGDLRRRGIRTQVISTPRDVAVGCGLSVRFALEDLPAAMEEYRRTWPSNLIGFYKVDRSGGHTQLYAVNIKE